MSASTADDREREAPATCTRVAVPDIVCNTPRDAADLFVAFFEVSLLSANTRAAYLVAAKSFLRSEPIAKLHSLEEIRTEHFVSYIAGVHSVHSPVTVRQHTSALRRLFEWLTRHGVLETDPALDFRAPSFATKRPKRNNSTAIERR